jgi:hypothetical protein
MRTASFVVRWASHRFWMHGGGDELDNLVLLCARHHWKVHEGGWKLIRTDEGKIFTLAPRTLFGRPRGPD